MELAEKMDEIEAKISAFREHQKSKYHKLQQQENELIQQLHVTEKRFEQWERLDTVRIAPQSSATQSQSQTQSAKPSLSSLSNQSTIPPALIELDREIQLAGGATGHWPSDDQQVFLSLFYACTTDSKLLSSLCLRLPHYSNDECRSHLAWWRRYCRWQDERKFIIQQYKANKQKLEMETKEREEVKISLSEQQIEVIERQQEHESREKASQKALIAAWRQQKLAREKEDEEKLQREFLLKQQREKVRFEDENARMKLELEAKKSARRAQQQEAENRLLAQQMEGNERQLSEKIERQKVIEAQHQRAIDEIKSKRAHELRVRAEEEKHRLKLQEQSARIVGIQVPRDAQRVIIGTAASVTRAQEVEAKRKREEERKKLGKSAQLTIQAVSLGHRSVPSWRQGI